MNTRGCTPESWIGPQPADLKNGPAAAIQLQRTANSRQLTVEKQDLRQTVGRDPLSLPVAVNC
jgi:hypothetical protein